MEIINLTVDNQHIVCDKQYLVSNTRKVYKCHFKFIGDEWIGATNTGVFKWGTGDDKEKPILLDGEGYCDLPVEAIRETGFLDIGVFGIKNDEQIYPTIFTPRSLKILPGSYNGVPEPTPDIYEQIVSILNQLLITKQDKLPEYIRGKYLKVIENDDGELILAWEDAGGGGGTGNYNELSNQPQINGYTLIGNKSATSLGLALKDNLDNTIAILNTEKGKIVVLQSDVSNLQTDVSQLDLKVATIEDLIPNQASSTNKLADKDFVNSSIGTQTAYFQGTYDVVNDLGLTYNATHLEIETALEEQLGIKTNNDYVFVFFTNPTTQLVDRYDKYKFTSDDNSWNWEYTLNNSSFTAEQWASINSGITQALVNQISTNATNITNLSGRVDDVEDDVEDLQTNKQDTLVNQTNIKSINGNSILGNGDLQIDGAVDSVNGKTGAVQLNASDVGAIDEDELDNYYTKAESDSTFASKDNLTHETWTFTLDDDTVVEKEVVLWTSQE